MLKYIDLKLFRSKSTICAGFLPMLKYIDLKPSLRKILSQVSFLPMLKYIDLKLSLTKNSIAGEFSTYVKIHRSKTILNEKQYCSWFSTYVKIHRSKTSNMYFSMKLTQIFIKFYFCCKIIVYWLKTAATIQLISLLEYIYNRFMEIQLESATQI